MQIPRVHALNPEQWTIVKEINSYLLYNVWQSKSTNISNKPSTNSYYVTSLLHSGFLNIKNVCKQYFTMSHRSPDCQLDIILAVFKKFSLITMIGITDFLQLFKTQFSYKIINYSYSFQMN